MKLYLILLLSVLQAFAQGTVVLNNRGLYDPIQGINYDAKVTLPNGNAAAGEAFTVGLFLVNQTELQLIEVTHFRTGIAAGFFQPVDAVVPGVSASSPATFRIRVWETSAGSYGERHRHGILVRRIFNRTTRE